MAETAEYKAKRSQFARILKNFATWQSLVESAGLHTITVKGEDYHYLDILEAFSVLPPRQREAVWLMCVEDLSEVDVAKKMGFTTWPTPVQQYKNYGLGRMMEFMEADVARRDEIFRKSARYRKQADSGD
jgi:DNA-directed RNA polymerase specialized sigma24 family protein